MRNLLVALMMVIIPATCLADQPTYLKKRMGTLTGQIMLEENKPMAGGIVSFFNEETGTPPQLHGSIRVPDAVARVESDGRFSARLLPGAYYMGALHVTEPGRGPGPPKPGEKFYFAVDDKKAPRTFTIKTREVLDMGKITALRPEKITDKRMYLTLEGTIVGPDGKPFPNAVVLVKKNPRSMRPEYVSQRLGEDGKFKLMIPGGTYYLMARQVEGSSIMGQPTPDSYVGTYGVENAPVDGIPGSSGPAGGITPPVGTGPQRAVGPATGISAAAGVDIKNAKPITGKAGETVNDLTIRVFPISRPGEIKAESYFNVIGTVQDSEGKPFAGMQVHAKENFSEFRPPFTSEVTDEAGTFHLKLPTGTGYYLLAKPVAMGPPQPGEPVGFYGLQKPLKELLVFLNPDSPEHKEYFMQAKSVTGNKDETVKDVVITAFPFGVEAEKGMISLPGRK